MMRNHWLVRFFTLLSLFLSLATALPIHDNFYNNLKARASLSGLNLSENPADWPNEAQLKAALKTGRNGAYFWSGRSTQGTEVKSMEEVALGIARGKGGDTLEGTLGKAGITMPVFDARSNEAVNIWNLASETFAKQASGTAFVVRGNKMRFDNVFHKSELPALKRNRNVLEVRDVDPRNPLVTKVIFKRNQALNDQQVEEGLKRRNSCGADAPAQTIPKRSNTFPVVQRRQAPAARSQRRKTGAAPACPLPGAAQQKKVVPRSHTIPKEIPDKGRPAAKPAARAPTPKKKVARPPNRPRRQPGAAAPRRKRTTPAKKPKKVPKPASKPRGKPRRRR